MRNKTELVDYLDGTNFLSMDKLYNVNDNLDIEESHDATKLKQMQSEFDIFKSRNAIVIKSGKLAPDSVINCK